MLEQQDESAILARYRELRSDPWEFLKCVRTLDQVDRVNPIKPFPVHLDYLQFFARVWLKERLILVPKSRRMKFSWTCIGLYTWDTMFNIGRHQAFVSKKEEDSDELVKRSHFIMENLDLTKFPKELIPKYEYVQNKLRFPELNSIIQGFPSGANQLRQYTFSGILGDEMAFWDDAALMYSNSYPTIEGGGRFTGISSVAPGFFQKLVFDRLEQKEEDVG